MLQHVRAERAGKREGEHDRARDGDGDGARGRAGAMAVARRVAHREPRGDGQPAAGAGERADQRRGDEHDARDREHGAEQHEADRPGGARH